MDSSASIAYLAVASETGGTLKVTEVDPTYITDYARGLDTINFDVNIVNQTLSFDGSFLAPQDTSNTLTIATKSDSGVTVGLSNAKVADFTGVTQGDEFTLGTVSGSSTTYTMSGLGFTYSDTASSGTFLLLSTLPNESNPSIDYDKLKDLKYFGAEGTDQGDYYLIQRILFRNG